MKTKLFTSVLLAGGSRFGRESLVDRHRHRAPRCGGDHSQRGDASPARLYSIVDVASVRWKPPLSRFMAIVRL